LLLQSESAIM